MSSTRRTPNVQSLSRATGAAPAASSGRSPTISPTRQRPVSLGGTDMPEQMTGRLATVPRHPGHSRTPSASSNSSRTSSIAASSPPVGTAEGGTKRHNPRKHRVFKVKSKIFGDHEVGVDLYEGSSPLWYLFNAAQKVAHRAGIHSRYLNKPEEKVFGNLADGKQIPILSDTDAEMFLREIMKDKYTEAREAFNRVLAEDVRERSIAIQRRDEEIIRIGGIKDPVYTTNFIYPRGLDVSKFTQAQLEPYRREHLNLVIPGLKLRRAKTREGKEAIDASGKPVYEYTYTNGQVFSSPEEAFGAILVQKYRNTNQLKAAMKGVPLTEAFLKEVRNKTLRGEDVNKKVKHLNRETGLLETLEVYDKVETYRKRIANDLYLSRIQQAPAGTIVPFYAAIKLFTRTATHVTQIDTPDGKAFENIFYFNGEEKTNPDAGHAQFQINEIVKRLLGVQPVEVQAFKKDGTPKVNNNGEPKKIKRVQYAELPPAEFGQWLYWHAVK